MPNPIITTLQSRWKSSYDPIKPAFDIAAGIVERIATRRGEVDANAALSDRGRAVEMNKFAGKQRAIFRKVRSDLAEAKSALASSRESLIPRTIDKSDAAAAALRSELRTFLRGMKPGEAIAWVSSQTDPAVVTAIWESVPALAGLDERSRDTLTDNWLKANRSKELAAIEERAEAIEVVEVAVNVAEGAIFTAAGERSEKWLESNGD